MLDPLLDLPQGARDAAYDNTKAVANSAQQLADFEVRSAALAAHPQALLDLPYGPLPRQLLDYWTGDASAPTMLFIHGGYWQMRHKNTFRFVAKGALQHGVHAALIGYTLAPQACLTQIVHEVEQGIAAVRQQALAAGGSGRILLCGWSAGGHLTAMGMACDGVVAGLGLSGIYELEPVRHTFLNHALQLTEAEVAQLSPLRLPVADKPLMLAYGTAELVQLQAQSLALAQHRRAAPGTCLAVQGADHFSILNALADPQGVALQALLALGGR